MKRFFYDELENYMFHFQTQVLPKLIFRKLYTLTLLLTKFFPRDLITTADAIATTLAAHTFATMVSA